MTGRWYSSPFIPAGLVEGAPCYLRDRGLSLSLHALRVAFAAGGDGESDLRLNLQDLTAFVRDPRAAVTALVLPLSGSATISLNLPVMAEQLQRRQRDLAARTIQRHWRAYREAKHRAVARGVRTDVAMVLRAVQNKATPIKVCWN